MNSITLTGRLAMQSTNGDGSQLLTEAAEFVNALAQLGVTLGVRIELAPVDASPAPAQETARDGHHTNEICVGEPTYHLLGVVPNAKPYNKDAGRTFDSEPAPANPQTAAPAQPDEPPSEPNPFAEAEARDKATSALAQRLNRGETSWRKLTADQRDDLVAAFLVNLRFSLNRPPTQELFNAHKPAWMPLASAWQQTAGKRWAQILTEAGAS